MVGNDAGCNSDAMSRLIICRVLGPNAGTEERVGGGNESHVYMALFSSRGYEVNVFAEFGDEAG